MRNRRYRAAWLAVGLTVLTLGAGGAQPAFAAPAPVPDARIAAGPLVSVIVRYDPAAGVDAAERLVTQAGGVVGARLEIIDGLAADVPADRIPALLATAEVTSVTPNGSVRLSGEEWRADQDVNSLFSITKSAGAHDVWGKDDARGRPITGTGVGVALIDSGVAPVAGLDEPGKVVNGPDLSFESQVANLRYLDTYGHGTHLAGIIAGRDAGTAGRETDPDNFAGVAPGAHVVSVKVAAADGATDVSQVIAAIDWVVEHRDDPGLAIKVLNLSFGTDSVQDARLDPLSYAVEVAWRKGIVVVVSVGNDGLKTRVSDPAINPYVIAVGAADPAGTEGRKDDTVADFSTRGNASRHADVLAAGRSIASLRNPGSFVDDNYPSALIPNDLAQRYFRGSGSSQAAAVVSGAAALLLQQRPSLTPDQVKRLLMTGTDSIATNGDGFGTGQINIKKAFDLPTPSYKQSWPVALGTGTIEGARGTAHVADSETGLELTGEQDIFGNAWVGTEWAVSSAAGTAWNDGSWLGTSWTGTGWSGSSWTARTWSARTWSARTWSGAQWSARTWSSAVWTGDGWSARTWSARTWSARTWSGGYWTATRWQ